MRCCRCTPAGASITAVTLSLLTAVTGLLVAFPLHDFVAEKIRAGVRAYAVLDSADAGGYKGWADSTDPSAGQVISRYWLNNLTNPEEVLRGAKPNLVEVRARPCSGACAETAAARVSARPAALRATPPPPFFARCARRSARSSTTTSTQSTTFSGRLTALR